MPQKYLAFAKNSMSWVDMFKIMWLGRSLVIRVAILFILALIIVIFRFKVSYFIIIVSILYKCLKKNLFVHAEGPPRKRARVKKKPLWNMPKKIKNEVKERAQNKDLGYPAEV